MYGQFYICMLNLYFVNIGGSRIIFNIQRLKKSIHQTKTITNMKNCPLLPTINKYFTTSIFTFLPPFFLERNKRDSAYLSIIDLMIFNKIKRLHLNMEISICKIYFFLPGQQINDRPFTTPRLNGPAIKKIAASFSEHNLSLAANNNKIRHKI